jgi:hypothetical protein
MIYLRIKKYPLRLKNKHRSRRIIKIIKNHLKNLYKIKKLKIRSHRNKIQIKISTININLSKLKIQLTC